MADAMAAFGLNGRLAVDCARPPSADNPTVVYRLADDDRVSRTLMEPNGREGPTYPISVARIVASDRIAIREKLPGGGHIDVVIRGVGGRFNTVDSVSSGGTVFVRDGLLVDTGRPLATFTRCGD
ncbi:MAG: hypothetical protein IPK81_22030 [Rhodospirillales bacterium]|nr:MAG: hypothetical protein IPK81_22030 [Rhodospirillales bacterium]